MGVFAVGWEVAVRCHLLERSLFPVKSQSGVCFAVVWWQLRPDLTLDSDFEPRPIRIVRSLQDMVLRRHILPRATRLGIGKGTLQPR